MLNNLEDSKPALLPSFDESVQGKRVVIIGDAAGIGRLAAAHLVERGARVFIAVCSPVELTTIFATIAKTGAEWDGMVVDWNQAGAVQKFFAQAQRRLGKIDALVDVMAAERCTGAAEESCILEAVQRMRAQRNGCIVQVAMPGRYLSPALRRQAGDAGVQITTVEAGGTGAVADVERTVQCVTQILAQPFRANFISLPAISLQTVL